MPSRIFLSFWQHPFCRFLGASRWREGNADREKDWRWRAEPVRVGVMER